MIIQCNKKARILLVNDQYDQLLAWEAVLSPLDEEIIKAQSGLEALRILLTDQAFAVILLDIKMPTMNGFETARFIRQRKKNASIPIVFITAADLPPSDQFVGYSLGAIDYLISPVEPEILKAKVAAFVQLYRNNLQVRESEQNFRLLAETIPEVFWMVTPEMRIIYVSPLYEKIWQQSLAPLIENPKIWFQTLFSEDKRAVLKAIVLLKRGSPSTLEYRICRPDNSIRWIYQRAYPLFDEYNHLYRITGVIEDITEKKNLEELARRNKYNLELAEVKYINSMGEIASTIAHELNQPLTAISAYTQGCIRKLQANQFVPAELIDVLSVVTQQAERAGKIIHRIKDLMRRNELSFQNASINDLILELKPLFNYEKHHSVKIYFDLYKKLPASFCDKIHIQQVLLNLVRNAIDALEKIEKPVITIHTRHIKKQIIVSVTDNGPGIEETKLQNMFRPHKNTQKSNLGMGLAICRTIIEAHGGQISVKPKPIGMCFEFTLPLYENLLGNF